MTFIEEVSQWFETGDFPTAAQFVSKFNKQRWKDELIQISEVEELQNQLNALGQPIQKFDVDGLFSYTIPANYIVEWILIKPSTDFTAILDDGNGNVVDVDVTALHGEPIVCMYNAGVNRYITIDSLPQKTIIYVKRYALPL